VISVDKQMSLIFCSHPFFCTGILNERDGGVMSPTTAQVTIVIVGHIHYRLKHFIFVVVVFVHGLLFKSQSILSATDFAIQISTLICVFKVSNWKDFVVYSSSLPLNGFFGDSVIT
jgi:hypothetical protein